MTGDRVAGVVAIVMMLTLVGSSLAVRRIRAGAAIRMALAWVGIFAVAFVLFTFRDEGRAVIARIQGEFGGNRSTVTGSKVTVSMSDDGHFWLQGDVNGTPVEFLVDSGATTTALSSAVATRSGLVLDEIPIPINTANGTVDASTTRIARLRVGPIVQVDARAVVSPAFGETNVIGMSFLSSLKGWYVAGRTLTLEP